mmetsp:Transcript_17800/g.22926  ORF Transcript_17800/g.22926 Transcript_17800/m.22926 type:complete len:90 (-) Transcript_17800:19-288(-)
MWQGGEEQVRRRLSGEAAETSTALIMLVLVVVVLLVAIVVFARKLTNKKDFSQKYGRFIELICCKQKEQQNSKHQSGEEQKDNGLESIG